MRIQPQGPPKKGCKSEGWVGWKKPPFAAVPLLDVSVCLASLATLGGVGGGERAHPDFEIRRVPCKSIYFSSPDRFDFT